MTINKETTSYKAIRAAVFCGVSAFIASLVTSVQSNPAEFGAWTAVINAVLVVAKEAVDTYLVKAS